MAGLHSGFLTFDITLEVRNLPSDKLTEVRDLVVRIVSKELSSESWTTLDFGRRNDFDGPRDPVSRPTVRLRSLEVRR